MAAVEAVVADGRHLLRSGADTYDIIYSDVATYAQYVSLGTVEFFALTRERLAPGACSPSNSIRTR